MKHFKRTALSALLALALLTTAAVAAGGSKSDPLVSLSYLEDTVLEDILDQITKNTKKVRDDLEEDFTEQIEEYQAQAEELAQSGSSTGSDSYVLVTLTAGQTMSLDVGCELMLRVGTATVNAGTSPALIDIATGGSIDNGASLVKNHLYMATIPDRTLTPTADTVKLLVRGGYTVS